MCLWRAQSGSLTTRHIAPKHTATFDGRVKIMPTEKKTTLDHVVNAVSAVLQTAPFTGGLAKYLE